MEYQLNALSGVSSETVLLLGFYITAAAYILFTTVMYYHWNQYSVDDGVTKITLITYFCTTVPLVAALGFIALSL